MKILFISDIILGNIVKKLNEEYSFNIDFEYHERIETYFLSSKSYLDYNFIYIHIDNIFKKKSIEAQLNFLDFLADISIESKNKFIVSNSFDNQYSSTDLTSDKGILFNLSESLFSKIEDLSLIKNLYFFDFLDIVYRIGKDRFYNYNLGHLYQMPYTKIALAELVKSFSEFLFRITVPDKKVIILDCDNTLWGGILGEDGVENIKCDSNHEGILFFQFQEFLLRKKDEGFLLALCSKNNYSDVEDAFMTRSFPLKFSDFIIKKINWSDKITNLKEISNELNLGLESFIFIDDSDFETESVSKILSEILVIKFKDNYEYFLNLLRSLHFRKKIISSDDLGKTKQYFHELERKKLVNKSKNIEDYIKSLKIKLDIKKNNLKNIERLSQLTEKTNQFNFNKVPYSTKLLESQILSEKIIVYSLNVEDKFGDYGTVGLIIILLSADDLTLENFIMSCRALGRRIEFDFFDYVIRDLNINFNKKISKIKFKENLKNKPAKLFIDKLNKDYEIID